MLRIKSGQWQQLQGRALEAFEQRTATHLLRYFPRRCRAVGRGALGQAIRLGLAQARLHGLESEACVRTYIESMCLLGSFFDTDPLLPWTRSILTDPVTAADPIGRSEQLYARTWQFIELTAADTDAWSAPGGHPMLIEALQHVRNESTDRAGSAELENAARRAQQPMWRLFPARFALFGEAAIGAHLPRSLQRAVRLGLDSPRGVSLVTVLTFALGDGFERDPLLPWIARSLAPSPESGGGDARRTAAEDRLFEALVTLLRSAIPAGAAASPVPQPVAQRS